MVNQVLARGRLREIIRHRPNKTEVAVNGRKLLQEDSPDDESVLEQT